MVNCVTPGKLVYQLGENMKVTNVYYITREDGSEYIKTEFDTKHYSVLNQYESMCKVFTPAGRKASDKVTHCACLAINAYYDNQ